MYNMGQSDPSLEARWPHIGILFYLAVNIHDDGKYCLKIFGITVKEGQMEGKFLNGQRDKYM